MKKLLVIAALTLTACSGSNVDRGVVFAGHGLELKDCLAKGRAAKDFEVYVQCADEVDARYGLQSTKGNGGR